LDSIVALVGRLIEWKHCPRCGVDVAPDGGRVVCPACGFKAYAHSDPTACALVEDDRGRLLLARRAIEPHRGKWDLPGGFVEEGEHPLDALHRELREETGLEIEPVEFVGAWIDRYGEIEEAPSTLNLYWTARVVAGEPRAQDDVSELAWFGPEELPPDGEIAFHVPDVIRTWWRESGTIQT
jgi:ADP-ribose pyrophosphatase YjhB (NUDIX family)